MKKVRGINLASIMNTQENKYNKLNIRVPESSLKSYQSSSANRQVLGCIYLEPTLLKSYKLETTDFMDTFQQIIFASIHNLVNHDYEAVDAYLISDYLKENFPSHYKIFERHNGIEYLHNISSMAVLGNFKGNFNIVKKWSVLRELVRNGVDVSEFHDPTDVDTESNELRRIRFHENDVDEIIGYYRSKILTINNKFNTKQGRDSIKAGSEEIEALIDKWKESNDFGLCYSSNFLTTVTYGIRKKRLTVLSAASGTGKTRINIANICHSFVPRYWNPDKKEWEMNPHGNQNRALYIGTEMELVQEIEPILLAYIACVPQDHIQFGSYEDGEEERVREAIRILREEANIFLEYVPDYDVSTLESIIEEHVTINKVSHVFFDYIHTTTELISEFQSAARAKMQVREDQVLANLSLKLKELTRKYNISIDTCTHVSGEYKNDKNRDATIIRGSKPIVDKIDIGYIVSRPTPQELKLISPIVNKGVNVTKPNICLSVYKNRGGKYNNVKIWLYIDYDTMRVHDMFITDYEGAELPIAKSYVAITEDQKVVVYTDKKNIGKYDRSSKRRMEGIRISQEDLEEVENQLSEEDQKRLQYHMDSTNTVAFLEDTSDTQIPDTELDEDDFDY